MTRAAKTLSVDPGSTDITGFNALRHRSTAPMKLSNNYRLSAFGPKRTHLAINLKTAKALGLTIPSGVLSIADEIVEQRLMSTFGPKRTSVIALHMSAFGGKADIRGEFSQLRQ